MNHKHSHDKKHNKTYKSVWVTEKSDSESCTCRRCRRQKKLKNNIVTDLNLQRAMKFAREPHSNRERYN